MEARNEVEMRESLSSSKLVKDKAITVLVCGTAGDDGARQNGVQRTQHVADSWPPSAGGEATPSIEHEY